MESYTHTNEIEVSAPSSWWKPSLVGLFRVKKRTNVDFCIAFVDSFAKINSMVWNINPIRASDRCEGLLPIHTRKNELKISYKQHLQHFVPHSNRCLLFSFSVFVFSRSKYKYVCCPSYIVRIFTLCFQKLIIIYMYAEHCFVFNVCEILNLHGISWKRFEHIIFISITIPD